MLYNHTFSVTLSCCLDKRLCFSLAAMIDICTWRARIGLYRAGCVGSSGRTRAKVLLASSADGVEDWSLLLALSTIMMELVVTVLIIIPLLVLLVDGDSIRRVHQLPASSVIVNKPGLFVALAPPTSLSLYIMIGIQLAMTVVICTLPPRKCSFVTLSLCTKSFFVVRQSEDSLSLVRAVISQQLVMSGDIETNPGPTACKLCRFFSLYM